MRKRSRGVGFEKRLRVFAEPRGIPLTAEQARRLADLDSLLTQWSRVLNLSGFRDTEERVARYFLEPLDALQWLPERSGEALDVGAGGGSPALPLAIARPGLLWTLLEPNRRRAVFLEEARTRLGLSGTRVERARLEDFVPGKRFLVITSRGVALGESALVRMGVWLEPGGRLLLFTGRARSEELLAGRGGLEVRACMALAPSFKGSLLVLEKPLASSSAPPDSPVGPEPVGGSETGSPPSLSR